MTITKAINRINWRLQNGWKANENDIEAINTIIDFVNTKHDNQFENNELFAKLYIFLYGEFLTWYKATVFDNIPLEEINKILDSPIELLIQKFINKATDVEQILEFESHGITKHPLNYTSEQKERVKIIDPVMTFEEATDNLKTIINHALDSYV